MWARWWLERLYRQNDDIVKRWWYECDYVPNLWYTLRKSYYYSCCDQQRYNLQNIWKENKKIRGWFELARKLGNINFDNQIPQRLLKRLTEDKYFLQRHGMIGSICKIFYNLKVDSFIFNVLGVPFPYMKVSIFHKK